MIKKQVIEMMYVELEELIQKTYGWGKYSLCAAEELDSAPSWTTTVVKNGLNEFDRLDLAVMKVKGPYARQYRTRMLMNDMCDQGILEPGDYVVEICW